MTNLPEQHPLIFPAHNEGYGSHAARYAYYQGVLNHYSKTGYIEIVDPTDIWILDK